MTYKSCFLTLALLCCTAIARAQYNQVNDIPYREAAEGYAQERCKLDVYYPTNETEAPVVVWFHGAMPFPAYKILKDHIKRLTGKKLTQMR